MVERFHLPKFTRPVVLAAIAALGIAAGVKLAHASPNQSPDNPYFAIAVAYSPHAFIDNDPDDFKKHLVLSGYDDGVGMTYGLAFDKERQQLYAGSDAGRIYQLNISNQNAREWARLEAGPEKRADLDYYSFEPGKNGLGDLEISDDGTKLFVTNLFDRQIYVLSLPDGSILGYFPAGGFDKPWAENARPFGLGYHDEFLYHGVVDSRENQSISGFFRGYVYRSRDDGSEMSLVSDFSLAYDRGDGPGGDWVNWALPQRGYPKPHQPLISDLGFRPNGELLIGLHDRFTTYDGDILKTRKAQGDKWEALTWQSNWFTEWTNGSFAFVPNKDQIVTSDGTNALWLGLDGQITGRERLCDPGPYGYFCGPLKMGDVESLGNLDIALVTPRATKDWQAPKVTNTPWPTAITSTPIWTPRITRTPGPTSTETPLPTATRTSTITQTPSPTHDYSPTPSKTPTNTATSTGTPIPRGLRIFLPKTIKYFFVRE